MIALPNGAQRGVHTLVSSPYHELVLGIEHAEAWPQEEEISRERRWPPWQVTWLTVRHRVARRPGVVLRRTAPPLLRGRWWPMRREIWSTVWQRGARRPRMSLRWLG